VGGAWSRLASDGADGRVYFSMFYVPDAGADAGAGSGTMWVVGDSTPSGDPRPAALVDPAAGDALRSFGSDAPIGSAAFDARRGVAVEIDADYGDVYEYDPISASWVQRASGGPSSSFAIWDPSVQKVLFVGGLDPVSAGGGDVWSWDGTTLAAVALTDPQQRGVPTARGNSPMAFDPVRQSVFLFGGFDHNISAPLGDTWELSLSTHRPAEVCRFPLSARRASPGSIVRAVEITAVAEAQNHQGSRSAPTDVALQVWKDGAWSEVKRCVTDGTTCGPAAPGTLVYRAQDPAALDGLLADLNLVGVALTPGSPNGTGLGEVGVRSLQVVITYVEP
jgi:hypothetical protein